MKKNKFANKERPFLGMSSFTEKDKKFFFGREEETKEIAHLIERNIITIFMGKSGIGKTSLLQSALIPILKTKYFFPIFIRFSFDENQELEINKLKNSIFNQIKKIDKNAVDFNEITLWEYFQKLEILDDFVKPILIFDQFEEIFTKSKKNSANFKKFFIEFGNFIENEIPYEVQKKYKNLDFPFEIKKQNFKALIVLRENFLPKIESFRIRIPLLTKSRFRLSQMKKKDALLAITKPNPEIINNKIANEILNEIYKQNIKNHKNKIEPFLLSLFCYQLNETRLRKKEEEISEEILKKTDIENILKKYYLNNTKDIEKNVKIIIEQELLTFDGQRKLQYVNDLIKRYKISNLEIDKLVNRKIIRKENWNDREHIEIIHDILVPIIKEIRDERIKKENIKKQKIAFDVLRKQEEKKRISLKEKNKKKIKFIQNLGITIFIAFVTLLFFVYYSLKQKTIAESNFLIANALLEKDKNPTLSFETAKKSYDETKSELSEIAMRLAYYSGDFYEKNTNFKKQILKINSSKNGELILTVSADSSFQLRKKNGKIIKNFFNKKTVFQNAKFSHNDNFILTIENDIISKIWNKNGELLHILNSHKEKITDISSSFDEKYFATSSEDNTVKVWDLKGNLILNFDKHKNNVQSVEFAKDTNLIISASKDRNVILWDLKGEIKKVFEHKEKVNKAIFLDEKNIITISGNNILNFWSKNEKNFFSKKAHKKNIFNLKTFSDSLILTISDDKTIGIWNKNGENISILKGHNAPIFDACFSNNGKNVISTSIDNNVFSWENFKFYRHIFKKINASFLSAEFSFDDKFILTSSKNTSKIWDRNGKKIVELIGHKDKILTSRFSKNGNYILTASKDKTVRLWDKTGKILQIFKHNYEVYSASFSPDNQSILSTSLDRVIRVFDFNGNLNLNIDSHKEMVLSAEFSHDGNLIVSASADRTARIYDFKGKEKAILRGHKDIVSYAEFSPNDDKIITSSWDKTAKLWDLEGNLLKTFIGHQGILNYATFSKDGNYIITASQDKSLKIWNLKGKEIFEYKGHKKSIYTVKTSNDDNYLITASQDGTVQIIPIKAKKFYF